MRTPPLVNVQIRKECCHDTAISKNEEKLVIRINMGKDKYYNTEGETEDQGQEDSNESA